MASYLVDRRWSDRFIPAIKQIVGPRLMDVTPDAIDCTQAADLMVFTARDMRVAARVRRNGFAERYPYEFTVRARRESGAETELSKIIKGWGDWMFYAHASAEGHHFDRWWLIDLHAFRAALIVASKDIAFSKKANGDGTYFVAYDLRSFPAEYPILISGSHDLPARLEMAA